MILLLLATACLPPFPAGPIDGDSGTSDAGTSDGGSDSGTDGGIDSGTDSDADGDGYDAPEDCDDADADVNPGAEEICGNGVDDNCDDRADPCYFQGTYTPDDAVGTITGVSNYGYLGSSVEVIPMESGPAVAVGAGWEDAGVIWFFRDFQSSSGTGDVTTASADLSLAGELTGDQSGRAMAVGDVDGDGTADLVVGGYATVALGSLAALRGTGPIVHVIHGPVPDAGDDLEDVADLRLTGGTLALTDYGHIEVQVADVLGTRASDVVVGFHTFADAAGRNAPVNRGGVVVFADGPTGDLDFEDDADLRIEGASVGDGLGAGVTTLDLTGDGIAELVLGAHGADGATTSSDGVVYIADVSASASSSSVVDVEDLADARIQAADATDRLGFTVANIGDFDGDGTQDLAIGADGSVYGQPDAGEVLVFHATGLVDSGSTISSSAADFRLQGQGSGTTGGRLGYELEPAGDVDQDGDADFYASGIWEDVDGDTSGRVHLVPGGSTGIFSVDDTRDLLATFEGPEGTDFGVSLLGTRDLSGDGVNDLAVGAWGYTSGRGRLYAFESPTW